MTKKELKKYLALKRELARLDKGIANLETRQQSIPIVMGKVTGSMPEFPYIEQHITVQMEDPVEADMVSKRLQQRWARKETVEQQIREIEQFVSGIEDDVDREIFELLFLEGKTQQTVADTVGYTQSNVSRRITRCLKDS